MSVYKSAKAVAVLLGLVLCSVSAIAQPGDPTTDPDVPITGIEVLLGIGGLYGAKKIMERRKK
jgi:hypothetical protein